MWIFLSAVAVILTMVFVVVVLASFFEVRKSSLVAGDPRLRDGIRITANVVDVAPSDRVLNLRLAFQPTGTFTQDGDFLSQPVKVAVLGGADVIHDSYDAAQVMLPADVRVPLQSGSISMYPLDGYESTLRLEVTGVDGAPIPTSLVVEAANPGYRVQMASKVQSTNSGIHDLTIRISRAPTTLFFAVFTSALMLAVTILTLVTIFWIFRRGADADNVRYMIPMVLVLLFAFPAIRSFIPGIPGELGVLNDFFAFFWCEVALGISLVIMCTYLARQARRDSLEPPEIGDIGF